MKYSRFSPATLIFLLSFSTIGVRADLTIRYKNEHKLGSLPAPLAAAMQQAQSLMPEFTIIQVKGNKAYSNFGKLSSYTDFATQKITLVDAAGKKFATLYMKDFADELGAAIPALPQGAAQPFEGMKSTSSSRKTGRTDTILGVQAEETETILSIEVSDSGGPLPAGPFAKQVIHIWTAKDEEALRVPAVRQWAGYTAYSNLLMDPFAAIRKMFTNMPGFGQAVAGMAEQGAKELVLKTHLELYMPMLAAPQQTQDSDPNAAIMEIDTEMVELSTNPIEDSVFQIPGDYQSAPVSDIMNAQIAPPATASAPAPGTQTIQRIRVGANVQSASLIKQVTPEYPVAAKQAGVEGTVRFTAIIDHEGNVAHLQLVSGHPLLVEPAYNAVSQWQYQPTLLNGRPIEVVTQIVVNFTLRR